MAGWRSGWISHGKPGDCYWVRGRWNMDVSTPLTGRNLRHELNNKQHLLSFLRRLMFGYSEMLRCLVCFIFPSVSLRLANEAWWLKFRKRNKSCHGSITPILNWQRKWHSNYQKFILYFSCHYHSEFKPHRSIQVPLLASTPWQQDWKWKDKDFGLHGYSAESLRMKICWTPYWSLLPFEKS